MAAVPGRPRVAKAYAWLISLLALAVILQGAFAAAGLYHDRDLIAFHRMLGDLSMILAVLVLLPLAFLARFPRSLRIGLLTAVLAVLWIVQYFLGDFIGQVRWLAILHVPNAFLMFGLALFLAGLAHRVVWRRPAP
jgi:hypothetical protein